MNYPLADLVDRLSILSLKVERLPENEETLGEMLKFSKELCSDIFYKSDFEVAIFYLQKLWTMNGKIWDLEADIRKGKEGELGLEEVGKRALMIRDLNKERILLKNMLAERVGQAKEVKGDHASA